MHDPIVTASLNIEVHRRPAHAFRMLQADRLQRLIACIEACGLTHIEAERVAVLRIPKKIRTATLAASVLMDRRLRRTFERCPCDPHMPVREWMAAFDKWHAQNRDLIVPLRLTPMECYRVALVLLTATGQL